MQHWKGVFALSFPRVLRWPPVFFCMMERARFEVILICLDSVGFAPDTRQLRPGPPIMLRPRRHYSARPLEDVEALPRPSPRWAAQFCRPPTSSSAWVSRVSSCFSTEPRKVSPWVPARLSTGSYRIFAFAGGRTGVVPCAMRRISCPASLRAFYIPYAKLRDFFFVRDSTP